MKGRIILSVIILAAAGAFAALALTFPIYAGMLPLLLFILLIDGYLWFSVRHVLDQVRPWQKNALNSFFWMAEILLLGSIIAGAIVHFSDWNIPVRTIIPGLIFIFFSYKIIPFIFTVIADIARLFAFGLRYYMESDIIYASIGRFVWIRVTGWLLGGVFLVLLLAGMIWWNYDFDIKKQDIVLPELPATFDGIKIVQISDIHLGSWSCKQELSKAMDIVNAQKPDMIFFTGDMANYTTKDVLPFENILSKLHAPLGIFTILGNHDYGAYVSWDSEQAKAQNMEDLYAFYQRLGWKLLMNEHTMVCKGNDSIAVLGVQNWGKAYRFQKLGDINAAENGVGNTAVQLLLSHDPSFWDSIICHQHHNIDITFSGHTHAFQFGIEEAGIKWSPSEYLYKQWGGLYSCPLPGSHPQYIYVNRGLGSLGYPGRIGELPEITVFTLKRE